MILGLLKWLRETNFFEKKKEVLQKQELCTKGKLALRKKEEFMNIWVKGKLILRISGSKSRYFSTQEVGRKMTFP